MKIFPVYYFPSISWFAALSQEKEVTLELHQHYRKQNYYNRMRIKGPNKVLLLTVPVVKDKESTPLLQRQVSYRENWQKNHWKSLEAAYRASPYFEFYEDRIQGYFEREQASLSGLNLAIIQTLLDLLQLDVSLHFSSSYQSSEAYETDYRSDFFSQGEPLPDWFKPAEYRQTFGESFAPDLSILDLLFNMGPESAGILRASFTGSAG